MLDYEHYRETHEIDVEVRLTEIYMQSYGNYNWAYLSTYCGIAYWRRKVGWIERLTSDRIGALPYPPVFSAFSAGYALRQMVRK